MRRRRSSASKNSRVDEVLEVVRDDDVGKARLVEGRGAERAEEDVGAEPLERRPVGRSEVEQRLEEAVQAPARAQDLARLLDVEARPEAVDEGALRREGRDGRLRVRFHEEVDFVGLGAGEKLPEEVEDEEARAAVPAVRRKGSEVDEDPLAHRPRFDCSKKTTTKGRTALRTRKIARSVVRGGPSRVTRGPSFSVTRLVTVAVR